MIDPIRHYALTSLSTVHDEEALTALELLGRIGAKTNELTEEVNRTAALAEDTNTRLPQLVSEQVQAQTSEAFEEHEATFAALLEQIPTSDNLVNPGAVRNNSIFVGMLGTDMSELRQNHYVNMANKWKGGNGYYHMDDRIFISHSGYTVSDPIPVQYGQYYKITTAIFGNQVKPVVFLNERLQAVSVEGAPGSGSWDLVTHDIVISRSDVKYIRVICGNAYISSMRVEYYTLKDFSFHDTNLATREHWHMHAKKRTDTITDRAQIKCWFPIPEYMHGHSFQASVSFAMAKYANIAEAGITLRIFAATSASTYDSQLPESAAGYTYLRSRAIDTININIPGTVNGENVTHVCLFMDFLPANGESFMDVWLLPPVLTWANGTIRATNPQPHGGLATDYVSIVRPAAALSGAHRKKIFGYGDSLMRGNTLPQRSTWFNKAAGALDMDHYNLAANGRPLTQMSLSPEPNLSSVEAEVQTGVEGVIPDYVIIQGGANDKRLSVPLANYRQAIRNIYATLRDKYPRAKILFMTNWRRTTDANSEGLTDSDYVAAMLEECEDLNIPCVNNYRESLNLLEPAISAWADEGLVSGQSANLHFSEAGNDWITERAISEIMKL